MKLWPLLALLGGCWHAVPDYCRGCAIVDAARPQSMRVASGKRVVVILVHGALGFGDEWAPVVSLLRQTPTATFVALAWRGPWQRPIEPARALLALVQSALDGAPPETTQVLILAHSAGGLIASWAVRHARIRAGRHLSLAKVACPPIDPALGFTVEREVDTPLGFAVGGTREVVPRVPDGAEIVEYLTADAAAKTPPGLEGRAVFLGANAGHNASLARVGLPLIRAATDGAPPLSAHVE